MLDIEKFDPTGAQLKELVGTPLVIDNPRDEEQVKAAHAKRMQLREARIAITKKGKELREDALKFQRDVIAKEKELVAIVEPEEERLQAFENEAEFIKEQDARRAILPRRRQQLAELGTDTMTDEEVLALDGTAFQTLLNKKLAEKNQREAKEIADRKAEQDAREAELARKEAAAAAEEEAKKREELARQQERERIEREAKEKVEREKREADELARKEAEAKVKRERTDRYREWRASFGWTEETETDYIESVTTEKVILYKKLGAFDLTVLH